MTFLQMINTILKKMDENTIAGVASHTDISAKIADWITLRFQEVLSRYSWPFLYKKASITTAANDYDYSVASDVMKLDRFWQTDTPAHLTPISYDQFIERFPDPTDVTGKPLIWCEYPVLDTSGYKQVYFYPMPDAIYTVNYGYYRTISDMSADGDVPGIAAGAGVRIWPAMWDNVIVEGAMIDALNYNEDTQALQQEIRWERMIQNMVRAYQESRVRRRLQGNDYGIISQFPDLDPSSFGGYWR